MKKLLFPLMLLGGWIGSVPVLRAQGTLTVPPPATTPQSTIARPPSSAQVVTLDVDASTQKAAKQKTEPKTSKPKPEQKKPKPKAGAEAGRANEY